MPDPLKTMSEATSKTMPQATSKAMLPSVLVAAAALALTVGLFAASGPASATPMQAGSGLTSPGLQLQDVGYRRYRKYQQFNGSDYYVSDSYAYSPSYRVYRNIPGGNDEIRELQRLFPETNWPYSLRY